MKGQLYNREIVLQPTRLSIHSTASEHTGGKRQKHDSLTRRFARMTAAVSAKAGMKTARRLQHLPRTRPKQRFRFMFTRICSDGRQGAGPRKGEVSERLDTLSRPSTTEAMASAQIERHTR